MLIKNVFGKVFPNKLKKGAMVINRVDGITVVIPEKAISRTGILKTNVAKRLATLTIENVMWLQEHYGIEFSMSGDKRVAAQY